MSTRSLCERILDWQAKMMWIQEDTERDHSQRKYGKNALVVGDGGDGENSQPATEDLFSRGWGNAEPPVYLAVREITLALNGRVERSGE